MLVDEATRFSWSYGLKKKSAVEVKLKEWIAIQANQSGLKLKILRSDNGGEFTKESLKRWLAAKGVVQEFTPPRQPQANGMVERMNRTLQD